MDIGERHHRRGRNHEHGKLVDEIPNRRNARFAAQIEARWKKMLLNVQGSQKKRSFSFSFSFSFSVSVSVSKYWYFWFSRTKSRMAMQRFMKSNSCSRRFRRFSFSIRRYSLREKRWWTTPPFGKDSVRACLCL